MIDRQQNVMYLSSDAGQTWTPLHEFADVSRLTSFITSTFSLYMIISGASSLNLPMIFVLWPDTAQE